MRTALWCFSAALVGVYAVDDLCEHGCTVLNAWDSASSVKGEAALLDVPTVSVLRIALQVLHDDSYAVFHHDSGLLAQPLAATAAGALLQNHTSGFTPYQLVRLQEQYAVSEWRPPNFLQSYKPTRQQLLDVGDWFHFEARFDWRDTPQTYRRGFGLGALFGVTPNLVSPITDFAAVLFAVNGGVRAAHVVDPDQDITHATMRFMHVPDASGGAFAENSCANAKWDWNEDLCALTTHAAAGPLLVHEFGVTHSERFEVRMDARVVGVVGEDALLDFYAHWRFVNIADAHEHGFADEQITNMSARGVRMPHARVVGLAPLIGTPQTHIDWFHIRWMFHVANTHAPSPAPPLHSTMPLTEVTTPPSTATTTYNSTNTVWFNETDAIINETETFSLAAIAHEPLSNLDTDDAALLRELIVSAVLGLLTAIALMCYTRPLEWYRRVHRRRRGMRPLGNDKSVPPYVYRLDPNK